MNDKGPRDCVALCLIAVEMGGVEPPSKIVGRSPATCVVDVLIPAANPHRQGSAEVSRNVLDRRAPANLTAAPTALVTPGSGPGWERSGQTRFLEDYALGSESKLAVASYLFLPIFTSPWAPRHASN